MHRLSGGSDSCRPSASHRAVSAPAQAGVGGHAAGDGDAAQTLAGGAGHRLLHELADDGRLVRGGDVGAVRLDLRRVPVAQVVEQRRLEAAEAEAAAARHGAREAGEARVAARRQLVQLLAARVAEPEQPGALVEGLAGRVVHGLGGDAVPTPSSTTASSVCPPLATRQTNGASTPRA